MLPATPSDTAISVVVPTRDRPIQLARCLDGLVGNLHGDDELIVVDLASRNPAAVASVATHADARLLRLEQPGVCLARNVGWRAAHHEFVAFVDDDVVVADSWVEALRSCLLERSNVGFITGRLDPLVVDRPYREVAVKSDLEPSELNRFSVGNIGHSANMASRRSVLMTVGGFDEALGVGGKFGSAPEADLFDRFFAAGIVGRYEPTVHAYHEQWRNYRELFKLDLRYGYGNGARLAKLARTDHKRARLVMYNDLWAWGLAEVWRELRTRNERHAALALLRVLGTLVGFARALPVRIVDGHFVVRR